MHVTVAACQYPIERLASFAAWQAKVEGYVAQAKAQGADLLLFPEYAFMELATLASPTSLADELVAVVGMADAIIAHMHALAQAHSLIIVAGTVPQRGADGVVRNRAYVFGAQGEMDFIEKQQMTRFEREHWDVGGGDAQAVFACAWGTFGVAICYDIEFPLIARRLRQAGASLILVPSCTDALAGYHRVRIGCQARALENQGVVVQATTVGAAPWLQSVDENVGAAGFFGPPDVGFASDGVLALGAMNEPGLLVHRVDLAAVAHVRENGKVFVDRDFDAAGHLSGQVRRVAW